MELGDPGWEPYSSVEIEEPEPETYKPEPTPQPQPQQQTQAPPEGAKRMYEPPAAAPPPPQDNSTQWAQYEPTNAIPPDDPFAPPGGGFMPRPPPGRMYGMYRQPPTWQHASVDGLGAISTGELLIASVLSQWAAIAAGAAIGYFLTGHAKGAGGGALAVMGVAQIPFVFKEGGLFRAVLALGGLGGAYWLLRDDSEFMRQRAMANEEGWDYDENDGEDEDEPESQEGGRPSSDPKAPAPSSPWLRPAPTSE